MRWRQRQSTSEVPGPGRDVAPMSPVVLSVTEPLTADTADRLGGQVDRLDPQTPVVIDLTGIPSFDSEGAEALVGLQERHGREHVTIVGLRQAAARLTGVAPPPAVTSTGGGWTVRRLHNLAVVQTDDPAASSTDTLEAPLTEAVEEDVAIVV